MLGISEASPTLGTAGNGMAKAREIDSYGYVRLGTGVPRRICLETGKDPGLACITRAFVESPTQSEHTVPLSYSNWCHARGGESDRFDALGHPNGHHT